MFFASGHQNDASNVYRHIEFRAEEGLGVKEITPVGGGGGGGEIAR